jgi:CBS domain-containing protein
MPQVQDIMTSRVVVVSPSSSAIQAARLMTDHRLSCLVVVENDRPVGIITERDFVSKIVVAKKDAERVSVKEIMSNRLVTVSPEASIKEASRLLRENSIRRLPVVEGERLVGIVTVTDFVSSIVAAIAR